MWFYDFKEIAEFDDAEFETYYESIKGMLIPDISNLGFRVVRDGGDIMLSPLLLTELRLLMFNENLHQNGIDLRRKDNHPAISLVLRSPGVKYNSWNREINLFETSMAPYEKLNGVLRDPLGDIDVLRPRFQTGHIRRDQILTPRILPRARSERGSTQSTQFYSPEIQGLTNSLSNGSEPFQSGLLNARIEMGLDTNSPRGNGIKIAVIDSALSSLSNSLLVKVSNTVELSHEPSANYHGVKVVSLLAGTEFAIAPEADYFFANVVERPRLSSVILAMIWAARQRVNIISISLQVPQRNGVPNALQRAVQYCADHNCQIIALNGNARNAPCSGLAACAEVISVGALLTNGQLRVAPMTGVLKTDCVCIGSELMSKTDLNQLVTERFFGSSASVPLVSGCYALFLQSVSSENGDLRNQFFSKYCTKNDAANSAPEYWGYGIVKYKP